ncbi:MAG: SHOCT domain-containing protein, partial [Accumulibacter sp.]
YMHLKAFQDKGDLIVEDDRLRFNGSKWNITISDIKKASYGKQGRDFVNNWVKIDYLENGTPKKAFFASGAGLGWGGVLGGTQKILNAIEEMFRNQRPKITEEPKREEPEDAYAKLTKLKKLFDSGILTEDEYKTKKNQLLEKL